MTLWQLATPAVENSFYVDNFLGGANTVEEAAQLQDSLIAQLRKGCMELRKWSSNYEEIIQRLPRELREVPEAYDLDLVSHHVKTLGVRWNPITDMIDFSVSEPGELKATMREVLSETAKTFDPLGWVSPVIIKLKILLQECWVKTDSWGTVMNWDDPLPPHLASKWREVRATLTSLTSLQIPRCVVPAGATDIELHLFCDASEKAYAAAIYIKSGEEVRLFTAKTRVAPVKTVSLPRLELCAAVLGIKLLAALQSALDPLHLCVTALMCASIVSYLVFTGLDCPGGGVCLRHETYFRHYAVFPMKPIPPAATSWL